MLYGNEQPCGEIEVESPLIVGRVQRGQELWCDSKERKVLNIWVVAGVIRDDFTQSVRLRAIALKD